jgi:RES domain-containing protein
MHASSRTLGLPVTTIRKGRFWRCLVRQHAGTVLEAGPSFTRERRYNVRGEFSALYFSGAKELSIREVAVQAGSDGEVMACVEFLITLNPVVDLTHPDIRRKLGVHLDDLIRPRVFKDGYAATQALARRFYAERLPGMLVPSVLDPNGQRSGWRNLIIFPANLIRGAVRELGSTDIVLDDHRT